MYQSFARPHAVLCQYLVTAAIIHACTGMAHFLSQVQLTWKAGTMPAFAAWMHCMIEKSCASISACASVCCLAMLS